MTQHTLPDLPYPKDALEPHISAETLEYHHGKHHASYVEELNKLIQDTELESAALEEIIREGSDVVFSNAAQVWNHSFYWNCLSPAGGSEPGAGLAIAIEAAFGSFAMFRDSFSTAPGNNFGSDRTWLVKQPNGTLEIVNTRNAGNPMTDGTQPLLTCGICEHAYYVDNRNARPEYVKAFWQLVNWEFVAQNFGEAESRRTARNAPGRMQQELNVTNTPSEGYRHARHQENH